MSTSISASVARAAVRWSAPAPSTVALPPVMAAAISSVAASMRSGMISYRVPVRCSTPAISIVSVPSPSMRAPIAIEEISQVDDFRLDAAPRMIGAAAGQRGGAHHVGRAGDGGAVRAAQVDRRAAQLVWRSATT